MGHPIAPATAPAAVKMVLFLLCAVLFLAYTNGANDNFKGVATLVGSRTAGYRSALAWGTSCTFLGSLAAAWISQGLVKAFSGRGLVPPSIVSNPAFLLAVGLGAALTVFLATHTGFPVSTTHALTGALVGAGWLAARSQVNLDLLGRSFFLPLAFSPIISLVLTALLYPFFQTVRKKLGVTKQLCLCVGPRREPVVVYPNGVAAFSSSGFSLSVGELSQCVEQYQGVLFGVDCQRWVDLFHYLSAGMVSFARGLNDTPKIVALLAAMKAFSFDMRVGFLFIGVLMAAGGMLHARQVARTLSQRITRMNHGQGFTANLVTSLLVVFASGFGVPVSTTHVSCGALFGIGISNTQTQWGTVRNIILSWIVTLPMAALSSALIYRLM